MINLFRALIVSFKAHWGQRDKGGKPYILHPLTVCKNVKGRDAKIVALLHDVFEDTDIKISDIRFLKEKQRKALDLLTHKNGVSYSDYIDNIKNNNLAKTVKRADLIHNSDLKRLKKVSREDLERKEKYLRFIKELK